MVFFLTIHIGHTVALGDAVIHQASGSVVGSVVTIDTFPERNSQQLGVTIANNPSAIAVVYVRDTEQNGIITAAVRANGVAVLEQIVRQENKDV